MQDKLHFRNLNNFIIISDKMIKCIIDGIKSSNVCTLHIDEELLIRNEYAAYLLTIINANRSQDGFRFDYLPVGVLHMSEIRKIICVQLKQLFINNTNCFMDVQAVTMVYNRISFRITYKASVLNLRKTSKMLFYVDPIGQEFLWD